MTFDVLSEEETSQRIARRWPELLSAMSASARLTSTDVDGPCRTLSDLTDPVLGIVLPTKKQICSPNWALQEALWGQPVVDQWSIFFKPAF